MADLLALLTNLDHRDVSTLLQSGNAVFSSPSDDPTALADAIEGAIAEQLGMKVRCLVRSAADLQAVIDGNPLLEPGREGSKMVAHFLSESLRPEQLAEYDPTSLDPERIALGDRVVYQWCPQGLLAAPAVGGFVERKLKVTVTARNWNTVTKLGVLVGAA